MINEDRTRLNPIGFQCLLYIRPSLVSLGVSFANMNTRLWDRRSWGTAQNRQSTNIFSSGGSVMTKLALRLLQRFRRRPRFPATITVWFCGSVCVWGNPTCNLAGEEDLNWASAGCYGWGTVASIGGSKVARKRIVSR